MTILHVAEGALDAEPRRSRIAAPDARAWLAGLRRPAARLHHLSTRTGVRLALCQALVLVCALTLAGYAASIAQMRAASEVIQGRVMGETASLQAEFVQHGAAHLPHTVSKRSRQWRGFDYRLVGPDGTLRAGSLPGPSTFKGWTKIGERRSDGLHRFLAMSTQLPDGSMLTVGQDLASEQKEAAVLHGTLLLFGALGVVLGLGVSYLFMGGACRRLAALVRAAHGVSEGRLDTRVDLGARGAFDDINELGAAFNGMLDEIAGLMTQAKDVSSAIAHDLRTPLTRVRHKLERLRCLCEGAPDRRALVDQIDAELGELLRSFDAMLRLAEIENQPVRSSRADLDLGEVAARVADAFLPDIEDAGRRLQSRFEPTPVQGDAELVSQALANLLDNALRHTPAGGPILVAVERRRNEGVLIVEDCGPGIPEPLRTVVLERFRRLDPSRSGPGSGLGLAIVAAIAKRCHAAFVLSDASPGLRAELRFRIQSAN
jgi:signal transduction histidine kinase